MDRFVVAAVGSAGWARSASVLHPFRGGATMKDRVVHRSRFTVRRNKHLLVTAVEWKQLLADSQSLTTHDIASDIRLSLGRVRQILRLASLHDAIQWTILRDPKPRHWRRFSEEKLRLIVSTEPADQVERFERVFGVKITNGLE